MNERIWEGVIQVLRPDDSPLTATARLWRRDDFFGTDWGGQLEIPIALRRALPPGEYTVVLGPDREAVAFIGLGPSNAASTFPTLTGTGIPPFGIPVPGGDEVEHDDAIAEDRAPAADTAVDETTDDPIAAVAEAADQPAAVARDDEAAASPEPATVAADTPPAPGRGAATAATDEADPSAAAPSKPKRANRAAAPPKPRRPAANAAPIEQEPVVSETAASETEIRPAAAPPIPLEMPLMGLDRLNGASAAHIAQTERLARSFLTAVESRDRLLAVDASGVEAGLFAAVQNLVEDMTGHIEVRLRGGSGSSPRLPQQLVIVSWLASVLGATEGRADLAELASTLEQLIEAVRGADDVAAATAA